MDNLIGQTFGRWTVLEKSPIRKDGHIQYLCECSCDAHTKRLVLGKTLKSGASKSCGCLRRERSSEANKGNTYGASNKQDLTNKHFGNLTAIRRLDTKKEGCWEWECICDCGEKVISNTRDLNAGRKTRCNTCSSNATVSKGEAAIIALLISNSIPFETQKTFSTCVFSDTQRNAKFDFFIDGKYLIEFDGEQHFFTSNSSAWKEKTQTTMAHDAYKNKWCKENNIPLIRIPYTRLNNLCIDDLKLETSQFIKTQAN